MKYRYEIITFERLGECSLLERVTRNIVANSFKEVYNRLLEKGNFIAIEAIIRKEQIVNDVNSRGTRT